MQAFGIDGGGGGGARGENPTASPTYGHHLYTVETLMEGFLCICVMRSHFA
jgi:hypothetical protein